MPSETEPSRNAPLRVLAVDDNPSALYATSRILRSGGYEVVEATTGAAALAAAATVDLVVLDVNLPDIDGFEVCRQLRARADTAQLPILHLSATFTNSADFELGFQAGADSYLTRPVEAPVLIATVRTLLFARQADLIRRGLDAKLRTMFKLAPVAIAIMDARFCYESVNPAYCALTGYSSEELIGHPAESYVLSDTREFDAQTLRTGPDDVPWTRNLRFQKKDGIVADVEWRIVREKVSGVRIMSATDVTQARQTQKAHEDMLASERTARTEAERSNRLKEEFLATISHELRNPLNAILGWASILSRRPDVPAPVMEGLNAIERNSRTQAQMISDLLDYAGITFGKMRLVPETINPYGAVRAAVHAVAVAAHSAGIAIEETYDDVELAVEADATRLQQIASNLLNNAVKFSPKGAKIAIEAGRDGENFRLVVTDHGKGIEPEYLPRIFERFSQQDSTTTRSHGGLGLGLAIVKQLVEAHNGSIEAHSAGKGRGAVLTVKMPLVLDDAAPKPSDSQILRSIDFSGIVALIVEDDVDARALTKRILTDVGATVVEASSAEAALACLPTARPNVLISDIGMAHQDGYQLIRQLRSMGYGAEALPAIALTAFARTEDRAAALAAGFQDHMVKPLDPQTLIQRLAAVCRSRR